MPKTGNRKSLDELEKEVWAPAPSMLETEAVPVTLDQAKEIPFQQREEISLNGEWQMVWDGEEEERLFSPVWADSIPAHIPCSVHNGSF